MNSTGISEFNQARLEWAIRLRYSPMPKLSMELLATELNAFRIGELRTVGKTWEVMMERDGELAINSEKRKADSACLEWQISSDGSPDGDKHAAALDYFYNNLTATKALDQDATGGVDELVFQTLSALDYYYSAHEILLRVDNPAAKEITAEFRHTPLWFFEARRGYLGYLKHIFDMYGQPCIAGEWLTAVNTGWMRHLTMPYCAKWNSVSDWLIFCRRYGSGFLEAISNATKGSQEWNDAAAALEVLAGQGTVLHSRDVEFKFVEQSARNQLPYQPVVELIDRLYAKCYRGVDLATGSRSGGGEGGGERAGGRNPVGASVQKEESGILLVRDAKWITGVFNDRIDRPILRYLFNEEPRAWFALLPPLDDTSSEDLQSLQTLVPMGLRVALKEVYKRFRWSVPDAGDQCLQAPQPPMQNAEGRMQNEEAGKMRIEDCGLRIEENPNSNGSKLETQNSKLTQPAQTNKNTPIAAGADPARNPGLAAPAGANYAETSSRQLPDTQVDAGAFWSRVGLAPRAADGQTLPMPSLGYAVPNGSGTGVSRVRFQELTGADGGSTAGVRATKELLDRHASLVARGLGNSRAAQALHKEITRRRLEQRDSQLETKNSKPETLPNDDDHFNPNEQRDKDGKWATNGSASATNSPNQTNKANPSEVADKKPQETPPKHLPSNPPVTPPAGLSDQDWNCGGLAFRDYQNHTLEDLMQRLSNFRKLSSPSEKGKPGEWKFWLWQYDSEYSVYAESNGKRTLLPLNYIKEMDSNPQLMKDEFHIVSGTVDPKTGEDLPNVASKMGGDPCKCSSNETDYGQNWKPKAEEVVDRGTITGPDGKPINVVTVVRRTNMTESCYCAPAPGTK